MSGYLSQWVNYGGEWARIGDIYMELPRRIADAWMSGYRGPILTERPDVPPDWYAL